MKIVLTRERQVWKAVIVWAQNMVQNNIFFNSCNEDNDTGKCFLLPVLSKIIVRVVGK